LCEAFCAVNNNTNRNNVFLSHQTAF